MLTQCPTPHCAHLFDFVPEPGQRDGICPNCGQLSTLQSLDYWRAIEAEYRRRIAMGMLVGGPSQEDSKPAPFAAMLEDVRSLWNVGSMFRTADAAGIKKMYLCGITGSPPRKEIAKTSLGAEVYVPWEYHANALEVISRLKSQGVCMVSLEYDNHSQDICQLRKNSAVTEPLCLVVGNEDRGVSAQVLALCDYVYHLPMRGIKTSLNVAVAFGIASYLVAEKLALQKQSSKIVD